MANTYELKIDLVDAHVSKDGLENVIYNVYYSYYGYDENENVTKRVGVYNLAPVDPQNFVPFDQITQSDIISWIESDLPLERFRTNMDKELSEKVNPTKVSLQIPEDQIPE